MVVQASTRTSGDRRSKYKDLLESRNREMDIDRTDSNPTVEEDLSFEHQIFLRSLAYGLFDDFVELRRRKVEKQISSAKTSGSFSLTGQTNYQLAHYKPNRDRSSLANNDNYSVYSRHDIARRHAEALIPGDKTTNT